MMEQCHAGGFNTPVINKSPAAATSVASAATEPNNSYVSADGNWDPFARDWIAAQAGHDAFGGALAHNADTSGNGRIEAEEAYDYANSIKLAADTPNFSESSEAGGDIALGQQYKVWWWWCIIIHEILQKQYLKLPPEEFYAKVRRLQPKLSQLAASLDGSPPVEELFSEHLLQARDLYQKYATAYAEQLAATITRVCRKQSLTLSAGMTSRELARCVEMAVNGTKSAYPALQPADAFLRDLEVMLRTLVAGAVRPASRKLSARKSTPRKPGDRR